MKVLSANLQFFLSQQGRGHTLLITAASEGKEAVVNLLLDAGADIDAIDEVTWHLLLYDNTLRRIHLLS